VTFTMLTFAGRSGAEIKTFMLNLVHTTRFWNNLYQVRWKIGKLNSLKSCKCKYTNGSIDWYIVLTHWWYHLHRNRRYFVIKLHTWCCLSYFLKTNITFYCIYQYFMSINNLFNTVSVSRYSRPITVTRDPD
jgi:hypothetical protein